MATPEAGAVVAGRFEIERQIGSGGMGVVCKARDLTTGVAVALKLLSMQGALDARRLERFAREARLLAELRHPSIVAYVAHGQADDGVFYLAMEHLEGEDLARRLSRGPLSVSEALALATGVASALAHAHREGVVHRDIKPANIFLEGGEVGRAKVLDFGVARAVDSTQLTRPGALLGTPPYMAPEQLRGQGELTAACDVFALGCVLYECLSGLHPFRGASAMATMVSLLQEAPERLSLGGEGEGLLQLIDEMLLKNADERLSDGQAVVDALGAIDLAGGSIDDRQRDEGSQRALLLATGGWAEQLEATTISLDVPIEAPPHEALLDELRACGLRVDMVAGGALLISPSRDEALRAEIASLVRASERVIERWPDARAAIVAGRRGPRAGMLMGALADRAARLLSRMRTEAASDVEGPYLDEQSARALGEGAAVVAPGVYALSLRAWRASQGGG